VPLKESATHTRESYDSYRTGLFAGTATCETAVLDRLSRIEQRRALNAFLSVHTDDAVTTARAVDAKIRSRTTGPLAGMIIAVKDVLCMKGTTTTCGSKMLAGHIALYDASVIERLRAADAVIIGKTNMDEFAMGSSGDNSASARR
jgi:aspartyl-tRNA(Asn)/glutamyl-tRNA(Gln) amidotransferase subunit A